MELHLHALVRGLVQGVGFRAWARGVALELGLSGWVQNRSDGSVEVTAEGDEQSLRQFERRLNAGPRGADVSGVEAEYGAAQHRCNGFRIAHGED